VSRLRVIACFAALITGLPLTSTRSQPTGVIPLGTRPLALVLSGDGAWVTTSRVQKLRSRGTLVRINRETAEVTARIAVGGAPGSAVAGAGYVWVGNVSVNGVRTPGHDIVMAVSPRSNRVAYRLRIRDPQRLGVDTRGIWALGNDRRGRLVLRRVLIPGSKLVKRILIRGTSLGARLSVTRNAVWVLTTVSSGRRASYSALSRIDRRTHRRVASLRFPGVSQGLAVGSGTLWMSTSGRRGGRVYQVDTRTNRPRPNLLTLASVGDLAFGRGSLWIEASDGRILQVDPRTFRALREFSREGRTVSALAADSTQVWTIDAFRNTVELVAG
jgi:hypothetical protein